MVRPADRYEIRPLIEALEDRGSTNFCRDAGRVTMTTWERWTDDGLTEDEAMTAANALGMALAEIWSEGDPTRVTPLPVARERIGELRRQLEPS